MDKNTVLISVACLFKEGRGPDKWLVAKQEEGSDWELPKIASRKAESTARGAIRMCGEQLGINAQVLEEAGRAGGVTSVNKRVVPQRHLYYLMIQLEITGEPIEFYESKWLEYAKAIRKLNIKRDRQMLKSAKEELVRWRKRQQKLQEELKRIELEKLQKLSK